MIIRFTYCKFVPDSMEKVKQIYNREIAPVVKSQKGNLGARLIEPLDKADDFISITEWATNADADAYESSGLYKSLVEKLHDFQAQPPVLKCYLATEVLAAVL